MCVCVCVCVCVFRGIGRQFKKKSFQFVNEVSKVSDHSRG